MAYNRSFRLKYARFVKWKPILGVWAVISIALATRAALFFGKLPSHHSRFAGYSVEVVFAIVCKLPGIPVGIDLVEKRKR